MSRFTKIDAAGAALPADATAWVAVLDNASCLMWSAEDVGDEHQHAAGESAATSLSLAGFSDWRLPTVEELFPLADRSRVDPAIDLAFFPTCKSDWYWTSSPWAPSPADDAWIVNFTYGFSYGHDRNSHARVRAVRSASPAGQ
jgi:hypothetical protein